MSNKPRDETVSEEVLADIEPVGEAGHEVLDGECTSSIAVAKGHLLETLWNHPDNAALKEARKDPRVLRPGDRVVVPPLRLAKHAIQIERLNVFVRKGVPEHLQLRFLDHEGKPLADRPYRVEIDGEPGEPAKTDEHGAIALSVPALAKRAVLHLRVAPFDVPGLELLEPAALEQELEIAIGRLEPIESPRGGAQRLMSLGYLEDAEVDADRFLEAVLEFQTAEGLETTGWYDEPTRKALLEAHET
ncbi:MAG: peptidoglycan-binding protein [Myxococcales bacterium]|nr:peptidoglycan-binding protein [Myxococcales bacterium]MCB9718545.1 peptidoglycan-binding protein [Myxococcales bacterium]